MCLWAESFIADFSVTSRLSSLSQSVNQDEVLGNQAAKSASSFSPLSSPSARVLPRTSQMLNRYSITKPSAHAGLELTILLPQPPAALTYEVDGFFFISLAKA